MGWLVCRVHYQRYLLSLYYLILNSLLVAPLKKEFFFGKTLFFVDRAKD